MKDENGEIMHEAQTEYGIERVKFVQQLMNEGLMSSRILHNGRNIVLKKAL